MEDRPEMIKSLRVSAHAIQRSKGHSTVQAAAYISGQNLHQELDKFVESGSYNYSNTRGRVVAEGIMTPANAPGYLKNVDPANREEYRIVTERLWNDAEHAGAKGNSINGTSWILPIPSELDKKQAEELLRDFSQSYLVDRGMVVQYAIHKPHPERGNDPRNIHAHLLSTRRDITAEGFARVKTISRTWDRPELITEASDAWEKSCNKHLELAGCQMRVDNRPHSEQFLSALERGDIERAQELNHIPGVHQGKYQRELILAGQESHRVNEREERSLRRWESPELAESRKKIAEIMKAHADIQHAVDERIQLARGGAINERRLTRGAEQGEGISADGITLEQDRGTTRDHDNGNHRTAREKGGDHSRGIDVG
jgi:hypothetical protein